MKVFLLAVIFLSYVLCTRADFTLIPTEVFLEKFSIEELSKLCLVQKSLNKRVQDYLINQPFNHLEKLISEYNLLGFLGNDERPCYIFENLQEQNLILRSIEVLGALWKYKIDQAIDSSFIEDFYEPYQEAVKHLLLQLPKSGKILTKAPIVLYKSGFLAASSNFLKTSILYPEMSGIINYSFIANEYAKILSHFELQIFYHLFEAIKLQTDGEFVYILRPRENHYRVEIVGDNCHLDRSYDNLSKLNFVNGKKLDVAKILRIDLMEGNFEYLSRWSLWPKETSNRFLLLKDILCFGNSPIYNPQIHKSPQIIFDFIYWLFQNSNKFYGYNLQFISGIWSDLKINLTFNDYEVLKYLTDLQNPLILIYIFSGYNVPDYLCKCWIHCIETKNYKILLVVAEMMRTFRINQNGTIERASKIKSLDSGMIQTTIEVLKRELNYDYFPYDDSHDDKIKAAYDQIFRMRSISDNYPSDLFEHFKKEMNLGKLKFLAQEFKFFALHPDYFVKLKRLILKSLGYSCFETISIFLE